jgi:hypothetical protein
MNSLTRKIGSCHATHVVIRTRTSLIHHDSLVKILKEIPRILSLDLVGESVLVSFSVSPEGYYDRLIVVLPEILLGRFFADNNVYLAISSILTAFNISKAVDEKGAEIEPVLEYANVAMR